MYNLVLKNVNLPPGFRLFSLFSTIIEKNCRIRTRIVRVEGKHADHSATTMAQFFFRQTFGTKCHLLIAFELN